MTLLSFPLTYVLGSAALPGLAPAGEVLSFASPKESTQRKGEPGSSSLRYAPGTLRCSARSGSAETRPAGSDICTSCSALACATRLLSRQWGTGDQNQKQQGRAMARPCGVRLFGSRLFGSLCRVAGLSSAAAGGSGRALSERSEFSPTPPDASSARYPEGALTSARLFFGDFLLAKQKKVTALPGAHPGNATQTNPKARKRKSHLNGGLSSSGAGREISPRKPQPPSKQDSTWQSRPPRTSCAPPVRRACRSPPPRPDLPAS